MPSGGTIVLPSFVATLPEGPDWEYEAKFEFPAAVSERKSRVFINLECTTGSERTYASHRNLGNIHDLFTFPLRVRWLTPGIMAT